MKKKHLSYVIISVFFVVIATIVFCALFLGKTDKNAKPIFSENEEITVLIDQVELPYFEGVECIGKRKAEITNEVRNAIIVSNDRIVMKNIKNYGINGSLEVSFSNSTVSYVTFKTCAIHSANDVDAIFKSVMSQIEEKYDLPTGKIILVQSDSTEHNYSSPDELYNKQNSIKSVYKIEDVEKIIFSEVKDDIYYVSILTK